MLPAPPGNCASRLRDNVINRTEASNFFIIDCYSTKVAFGGGVFQEMRQGGKMLRRRTKLGGIEGFRMNCLNWICGIMDVGIGSEFGLVRLY